GSHAGRRQSAAQVVVPHSRWLCARWCAGLAVLGAARLLPVRGLKRGASSQGELITHRGLARLGYLIAAPGYSARDTAGLAASRAAARCTDTYNSYALGESSAPDRPIDTGHS